MPELYTKTNGTVRGKKQYRPDPKRFIWNIDTMWYTYDADNYDSVMSDGFMQRLEEGKSHADETGRRQYVQVELERYAYPVTFEIEPGGQAPIYAFQIRNKDMAIYFARKRRNDGTFPVKVQINQFKLWELGARDAFVESLLVLSGLGFRYEASKSNRVDLCVHSDQFDWRLDDLKLMDYPRNVGDTNKPDILRVDLCTGEFGTAYYGDRSRLQLRIYNKSKEIEQKKKDYFRDIYLEKGMDPDKVWNVEFEIHRDYLKNFADPQSGETNIFDSMDFLLRADGMSLLWTHLMEKFNHPSAYWSTLAAGDSQHFVTCDHHVFRLKDIDTSAEREIAQIRGRLQTLVLNKDLPDDADLLIESMKIFTKMFFDYEEDTGKDFASDVYKKRKQYMDIEMLKLALAERRKTSDKMELLNKLLLKKNADSIDKKNSDLIRPLQAQ